MGLMYNVSTIVNAGNWIDLFELYEFLLGFWLLKKWKKSKCLS